MFSYPWQPGARETRLALLGQAHVQMLLFGRPGNHLPDDVIASDKMIGSGEDVQGHQGQCQVPEHLVKGNSPLPEIGRDKAGRGLTENGKIKSPMHC